MHIACQGSVGFTNMILYAMTPKVKKLIKEKVKSCLLEFRRNQEELIDVKNLNESEKKNTYISEETEQNAI